MGSSVHVDNKKKYILILGKHQTQGLEHTLTAEKIYLHYNGANSYLFVNGTEIYKLKAKDSETVAVPLCLRNFSKDWSVDNMKKTGFNGCI